MQVAADEHMHLAQARSGEQRARVPARTPGVPQVVEKMQTAQEVGEPTCSSRWRRTGRPVTVSTSLPLWTGARLGAEVEAAVPTCSGLRRSVRVRKVLEIVAGERAGARQQRVRDRRSKNGRTWMAAAVVAWRRCLASRFLATRTGRVYISLRAGRRRRRRLRESKCDGPSQAKCGGEQCLRLSVGKEPLAASSPPRSATPRRYIAQRPDQGALY
jgi:hypothetical protein